MIFLLLFVLQKKIGMMMLFSISLQRKLLAIIPFMFRRGMIISFMQLYLLHMLFNWAGGIILRSRRLWLEFSQSKGACFIPIFQLTPRPFRMFRHEMFSMAQLTLASSLGGRLSLRQQVARVLCGIGGMESCLRCFMT